MFESFGVDLTTWVLVSSSIHRYTWLLWISLLFASSIQFWHWLGAARVWFFYVWNLCGGHMCWIPSYWMDGHCRSSMIWVFQTMQRFRQVMVLHKHILSIWELPNVCADFCPWDWRKRGCFDGFFHQVRCGDLTAEWVFDRAFNKSVHASEPDLFSEEDCCFYNFVDVLCLEFPWQNYPVPF